MRVTAKCRRVDDWWAVEVPEVPGVFTQAPNLEQVPAMVRDAVTLVTDVPPGEIVVDVEEIRPELDAIARQTMAQVVAVLTAAAEDDPFVADRLIREILDGLTLEETQHLVVYTAAMSWGIFQGVVKKVDGNAQASWRASLQGMGQVAAEES